ncbi:MAG: methyltransferase domain-containing protein [Candidatus Rehaiarchaeum fermentans]|nr:methyltransferase domain-containing protein [Candidatus Rehaiarchaeum fermentans]
MKKVKTKDAYLIVEGLAIYSVISKKLKVGGYWDNFIPLYKFFDNPKILLIGVGGGTMLRQMEKLGYKNYLGIDNNKEILKFLEKNIREKVKIIDGFEFMKTNKEKFDLIIVDAYKGIINPLKFYSNEFLTNSYNSLKSKGIISYNHVLNVLSPFLFFKLKMRKDFDFKIRLGLNSVIIGLKNIERKDFERKIKKLSSYYNTLI